MWRTTDPTPTILKRYGYAYDAAGNRTVEQVDDVPFKASYNNMNRLLAQDPGGITRFAGTLSEAAKVTIQSKPVTVTADNKFSGTATLAGGTNSVGRASDRLQRQHPDQYVSSHGFRRHQKLHPHDPNGNMTGDGTRTFEWDAENRLTAVNNGTHRSEFTYDGLSRRIRIVEKENAIVSSDVRLLWCELQICEERESTGATTDKRFFPQGEQQGNDNYFYTADHLGSVHELTDSTANVQARYDYDPYGRRTKVSGSNDTAFAFTGHYMHVPSGLALAPFRAYDPSLARWISQDPIGLRARDLDLYRYVNNQPSTEIDSSGLVWDTLMDLAFLAYDLKCGGWGDVTVDVIGAAVPFVPTIGLKVGIKGVRAVRAIKPVNLPAWKKIAVDIEHILDRHVAEGALSAGKTLFPPGMTATQIEKAVQEAYRYGERIATQGERVLVRGEGAKLTIEMWINTATKTIETAYPVF